MWIHSKMYLNAGPRCPQGCAVPSGVSRQQGEDEGRAGHDAEPAECHAEVCLSFPLLKLTLSLHLFMSLTISFCLPLSFC